MHHAATRLITDAIANPDITARPGLQHPGKVFRPHGRLQIPAYVFLAHYNRRRPMGFLSFDFRIYGRGVAAVISIIDGGAVRLGDTFRHPLIDAIKAEARTRNDRRILRLLGEDDRCEDRERAAWAQLIAEDRAARKEGA